MRRLRVGEPVGLGFYHRAEVVAAIGALLLQVEADCGQVVIADRFGKHGAVALGAGKNRGQSRLSQDSPRLSGTCFIGWS